MPKAKRPRGRPPLTGTSIAREEGRVLMSEPFLDDSLMDGSPLRCSLAEFQQPRLRQCAFDLTTLSFTDRVNPRPDRQTGTGLDGGLDGYNWKVRFGESAPFILKIFWDDQAPEPPHYFAAQRECQNAALFQLMQAAVSPDYADLGPILVDPSPETKEAAEANLFAFSTEVRLRQSGAPDASLLQMTVVPRLRQCFGWLKLTGMDLLRLLPRELLPPYMQVSGVTRSIQKNTCYTAVIYEFVEEGENDPEVVQQVLDFFWYVGFSHTMMPKASNWKSGVLVDLSDIVHPGGYGWTKKRFGNRTAKQILR